MATVQRSYYPVRFGLLLVGVILIVLAAFGIKFPMVDTFMIGVAFSFGSLLVP